MTINSKRVLYVSLDCLATGAIAIVAGFVLRAWQTAKVASEQATADLANSLLGTYTFKSADVFPAWPHWALIGLGTLLVLTGVILSLVRYVTEESA